jgi:Sec-independent protein secretion pathway component TatC
MMTVLLSGFILKEIVPKPIVIAAFVFAISIPPRSPAAAAAVGLPMALLVEGDSTGFDV